MKIFVFGLGAIGSNLIIQLMKQYSDFEYVGIDFDKIEERNIKTQAYFLEQVGMPKVHAIPIIAQRFLRKIKYIPKFEKIEPNHTILTFNWSAIEQKASEPKDTLFVDCFDTSASRKCFNRGGQDANILHIGFSPFYTADICWHKDYEVPGDIDPKANDICEMNEAISFIHYIVNFAIMVITTYIKENKKENYIINKYKIKRI